MMLSRSFIHPERQGNPEALLIGTGIFAPTSGHSRQKSTNTKNGHGRFSRSEFWICCRSATCSGRHSAFIFLCFCEALPHLHRRCIRERSSRWFGSIGSPPSL